MPTLLNDRKETSNLKPVFYEPNEGEIFEGDCCEIYDDPDYSEDLGTRCQACYGTGLDRYDDVDCIVCYGEGVLYGNIR